MLGASHVHEHGVDVVIVGNEVLVGLVGLVVIRSDGLLIIRVLLLEELVNLGSDRLPNTLEVEEALTT